MGWADGLGDSTPAPDEGAAAPSGSGWASGLGGGTGSGWASGLGGNAAAPAAAAPPAGHKGFFGQLGSMVNPANLVKGVVHLAGDTLNLPAVAAHEILGDNGRGMHVVAQQVPTLYQTAKHVEQTAQGVPDIAVNAAEDTTGHGPGLANSIYGRRIHDEGVLGGTVSTLGDAAMIASGLGMLGKAAGFGNLAKATEAEGLAARAVGNAAKGDVAAQAAGAIDTSEKATAAAQAARAAGNVSKAAEYESAASNLAKAEASRAAAAARGGLGQAAERATAGADTVAHFGNQVAGAPAELYTKLIPKVANVVTAGKAGELAAAAGERLGNTEFMQNRAAGSTMKELMGRSASEEQRLANPVNAATAQIQRLLPEHDEQVAAYLSRTGDAGTVLAPLAKLPDAQIQATIDANPYLSKEGVTPAAVRLAVAHDAGTLPAEQASRFDQAHQLMDEKIYGPKEGRHVTGYGDKAPMNPIKQAGREANVAGEAAPLAVGQLEDRLTAPIDKRLSDIEAEVQDIRQRNLDPQTGELSEAAKRQIARDEAKARTLRQQVAREEARQAQVASAAEQAKGRVETASNNRIGSIAGRAREQMAEAEQLDTGLKGRQAHTTTAASRAEALAAQGEKFKVATEPAPALVRPEGAPRLPALSDDVPVLQQTTTRGVAANEARAAADEIAGVRSPKTQAQVQQQTNRAASVANARTAGEGTVTERLTGAEAGRQESALQAAQRRLAAHETTAGARAEKLGSDAAVRAFRNDQNRLATLDEQRSTLQAKRDEAVSSAPNHPSVQAPQVRSLLSHASAVSESLLQRADELEATDPGLAAQLRAAAEAQPKTPADLGGAAKYIAGGAAAEGGPRIGQSSGQRMRSRALTGSERARETDVAPLTAEGQQKQVLSDIAGRPRNELPRMVQHELGDTASAIEGAAGLEGEALAAHLRDEGYTAWDPEGSGGKLADHKVTADSPVLPTRIMDQYQKWNPTKDPGWLARAAGTLNKTGRTLKLLGSAFPLHKMGADTLLDAAVAGVNPLDIVRGIPGAVRDIRTGDLPADVGIQRNYPIEPADTVGGKISNVGRRVAGAGMKPFRMIDTANRDIVYKRLIDKGYSPQTAAEVTKLAAGDLQSMSPREKAAGRAVLTYYPWQKHLATIAKNLVTSHPAGLAEAASIAQADAKAHPGQTPRRGELSDFMNPFGSAVFAAEPTKAGESRVGAIANRVQQSLNPLLQLGGGALAGVNIRKGQPVTTPSHPFGSQGTPEGPLWAHPGDLAGFALHTLVPQVGQIQDVVGGATAPGGFIPYRQDTGQPESKTGSRGSAGEVQAEADTTRADALARLLGYPHAEKPAPKKTKRGRG